MPAALWCLIAGRARGNVLMRVARPQDVLVGADLDAQADSLARWVVETLAATEALLIA